MNTRRFLTPWMALCLAALVTIPAAAQQADQRGGRGGPGLGERGGPGPGPGGTLDSRGFAQRPEKVTEGIVRRYRELDEKALAEVPPRDYQIKLQTEPAKTALFRADPKLFENKFVASFVVLAAGVDPTDQASVEQFRDRQTTNDNMHRSFPDNLRMLTIWGDGASLFHAGSYPHLERTPLNEFHRLLVEQCPANQRPQERVTAFLTSADCNRDIARLDLQRNERLSRSSPQPKTTIDYTGVGGWQYAVYAPTKDEAELRVAAILKLLDGGMSRPIQLYLLARGRESLELALKTQAEIAEKNEAIRIEEDKLTQPSEISPDILSQLKAQRVMVAVELAGLIARVKACDEMLKDPKQLEISTLQSVSDMKVKAEIERVGIKEKLDQINRFITEGDGRESANSKILTLQFQKRSLQQSLQRQDSMAVACINQIELYAPLQIGGNQVTISPIEWTN